MNRLVREKVSAERLLHDQDVLEHVPLFAATRVTPCLQHDKGSYEPNQVAAGMPPGSAFVYAPDP